MSYVIDNKFMSFTETNVWNVHCIKLILLLSVLHYSVVGILVIITTGGTACLGYNLLLMHARI